MILLISTLFMLVNSSRSRPTSSHINYIYNISLKIQRNTDKDYEEIARQLRITHSHTEINIITIACCGVTNFQDSGDIAQFYYWYIQNSELGYVRLEGIILCNDNSRKTVKIGNENFTASIIMTEYTPGETYQSCIQYFNNIDAIILMVGDNRVESKNKYGGDNPPDEWINAIKTKAQNHFLYNNITPPEYDVPVMIVQVDGKWCDHLISLNSNNNPDYEYHKYYKTSCILQHYHFQSFNSSIYNISPKFNTSHSNNDHIINYINNINNEEDNDIYLNYRHDREEGLDCFSLVDWCIQEKVGYMRVDITNGDEIDDCWNAIMRFALSNAFFHRSFPPHI